MKKISSVVLAAALLGTAPAQGLRPPIDAAGDSIVLNLRYAGHDSLGDTPTDITTALHLLESSSNRATFSYRRQDGTTRTLDTSVAKDGELASSDAADFVTLYNTIPLVLRTNPANLTAAHAVWSSVIPVKISETEWKNVPVKVVSDNSGGHANLQVTSAYSNLVFAHGFTVGEDIKVSGNLTFQNGSFTATHFDVHEVVHAYNDIQISYHWDLSS